jgi:hypothetical protein
LLVRSIRPKSSERSVILVRLSLHRSAGYDGETHGEGSSSAAAVGADDVVGRSSWKDHTMSGEMTE